MSTRCPPSSVGVIATLSSVYAHGSHSYCAPVSASIIGSLMRATLSAASSTVAHGAFSSRDSPSIEQRCVVVNPARVERAPLLRHHARTEHSACELRADSLRFVQRTATGG